jgi:hypothetical protein
MLAIGVPWLNSEEMREKLKVTLAGYPTHGREFQE